MPHLNWNWELEIQHNPKELGEPYELYFFLGPVPSSPAEWRESPSRLFEPIISPAEEVTREFRDLNGYLDYHCKGTLTDADVIPYLRKHLSWRVKKHDSDEEIGYTKLKALKVLVYGPDGATTLGSWWSCPDYISQLFHL